MTKRGQKLTPDQAARQRERSAQYYRDHKAEVSAYKKRWWAKRTAKAAKAVFDAEHAAELKAALAVADLEVA